MARQFIDISMQRVLYSRLDYVLAPMIVGETDARLDHLGLRRRATDGLEYPVHRSPRGWWASHPTIPRNRAI